jgi:cell division protein FtsZ
MKGARGLLISITGGKDLTLFEVDEAATRIREEVDPDANIILGATFDESLEGIIRCSVVATGIESERREDLTPTEIRMADLNSRLKTASQPAPAVRPTAASTAPLRPAAIARPAALAAKPAPAPMPAPAPAPEYELDGEMAAALAAEIERPIAPSGITITPFEPAPIRYASAEIDNEPHPAAEEEHVAAEAPFIPPAPEAPPQKMPRVEDFPAVAQRQMEARHRGADEDRGPLSLLRRLASVGLGRREEDPIGAGPVAREAEPTLRQQPPARPQQRVEAAPQQPDYAKRPPQPRAATAEGLYRPRQGDLDPHGRPLPRESRGTDDELEIPAFLRRQAN